MDIDNAIDIIIKMSPIVALIFGLVLYSVKKYTENNDSVVIQKIIKSF